MKGLDANFPCNFRNVVDRSKLWRYIFTCYKLEFVRIILYSLALVEIYVTRIDEMFMKII